VYVGDKHVIGSGLEDLQVRPPGYQRLAPRQGVEGFVQAVSPIGDEGSEEEGGAGGRAIAVPIDGVRTALTRVGVNLRVVVVAVFGDVLRDPTWPWCNAASLAVERASAIPVPVQVAAPTTDADDPGVQRVAVIAVLDHPKPGSAGVNVIIKIVRSAEAIAVAVEPNSEAGAEVEIVIPGIVQGVAVVVVAVADLGGVGVDCRVIVVAVVIVEHEGVEAHAE
jgi:hypothetical protein